MKRVYTNRPINRQRSNFASVKTIVLTACLVLTMVAIKVIYKPDTSIEDIQALAEAELEEETQEMS